MNHDGTEPAIENLYRGVIMEHYRQPCNRRPVEEANAVAHGKNALCGDDVRLELRIDDGQVVDAGFDGEGCAICLAATSMLTEMLVGRKVSNALSLIHDFVRFIKGDRDGLDEESLEDLAALDGVSRFPVRVKCALLPFLAVEDALAGAT